MGSRRFASIALIVLCSALGFGPSAIAGLSPETDVDALRALASRLEAREQNGKTALYQELYARTTGPQGALNADPDVELMFMSESGHPMFFKTENIDAAVTLTTDEVWPGGGAGLSLDGSSTTFGELAVWDAGAVRTSHQEFGGRVVQADGASSNHYHSIHVAGTMVAAGVDSDAKGMSYAGRLDAYDWSADGTEMGNAAAAGLNVSNHSYGFISGWYYSSSAGEYYWYGDVEIDSTEDFQFGFYSIYSAAWDSIAYLAPSYMIVASAGNDRNDCGPGPGGGHWAWDPDTNDWEWSTFTRDCDYDVGGWDCISYTKVGKNVLSIGAVEDIPGGYSVPGDVVQSSFSGWGPTDDGRIKPDFVANGVGLYSTDDDSNTDYRTLSGTSMASPNAAGSINLLFRHYETTHGSIPRAATIKAVMMNTANEAGATDGPDYMNGWGLINTRAAAELIGADAAAQNLIREESIADGESDTFTMNVDGTEPLHISMAWTDPAGTPVANALDPTDLMLVNDLDVRIDGPGGAITYMPYILDPANPGNAATRGDNFRDNSEQIHSASPAAGTYTVTVNHKGTLASPQAYSIASSYELMDPVLLPTVAVTAPIGSDLFCAGDGSTVLWTAGGAAADSHVVEYSSDGGTAWSLIAAGSGDGGGSHPWTVPAEASATVLVRVTLLNGGGSVADTSDAFAIEGAAWADATVSPLDDLGSANSVSWVDYDGDGDDDIYLANDGANVLLRNDAGTFVDATTSPIDNGADSECGVWADYDNDGDLDLFVANRGAAADKLYRNDSGTFVDVTSGPMGVAGDSQSAVWLDYDGDGEVDLYVTSETPGGNKLYRNVGGSFSDATHGPLGGGATTVAVSAADADNDDDADLYLCNDGANEYFRNDGGVFVDATAGPLGDASSAGGSAWGDIDNDGDLDLFIANDGGADVLLRNDAGSFVDITGGDLGSAASGMSPSWADVDHDGDLDLMVTSDGGANRFFFGNGDGSFDAATPGLLGSTGKNSSAAWSDHDGDGDLDHYLAAAPDPSPRPNSLIQNDLSGTASCPVGNWFHVRAIGTASNAAAIGAKVRVTTAAGTQVREVNAGSGHSSQGSLPAEFGLAQETLIDSAIVRWPTGQEDWWYELAVDQLVTLVEGAGNGPPTGVGSEVATPPATAATLLAPSPNPFNPTTAIRFELGAPGLVELKIYSATGRLVRDLSQGRRTFAAGAHTVLWNGRNDAGRESASGTYFFTLETGGSVQTRRATLVR